MSFWQGSDTYFNRYEFAIDNYTLELWLEFRNFQIQLQIPLYLFQADNCKSTVYIVYSHVLSVINKNGDNNIYFSLQFYSSSPLSNYFT